MRSSVMSAGRSAPIPTAGLPRVQAIIYGLVLAAGCSPNLNPLPPDDASTVDTRVVVSTDGGVTPDGWQTPDAAPADSTDAPVAPPDVTDVPDASVDAIDVADAPGVMDALDVADAPDVMDVVDARALRDSPDSGVVSDIEDVRDVTDASDLGEVSDALDVVDVPVTPMDLGPPPCLLGQDRCGGVMCLNLGTDIINCGGCGNACPSRPNAPARCSGGSCTLVCHTGYLNCDGNLTNGCETTPATDALNCGACGRVCPSYPNTSPSMCVAGTCSFGCGAGYANCDGNITNGCEVSTTTDPTNCGACGRACGAGQTCTGGTCTCTISGRPACGGACPNYFTDVNNCGACGNVCETGQGCCNGGCFWLDRQGRCGSCTARCSGTTPTCAHILNFSPTRPEEWACRSPLPPRPGFTVCGAYLSPCCPRLGDDRLIPCTGTAVPTYCFDFGRDRRNCGGCGIECPVGQNCIQTADYPISMGYCG